MGNVSDVIREALSTESLPIRFVGVHERAEKLRFSDAVTPGERSRCGHDAAVGKRWKPRPRNIFWGDATGRPILRVVLQAAEQLSFGGSKLLIGQNSVAVQICQFANTLRE